MNEPPARPLAGLPGWVLRWGVAAAAVVAVGAAVWLVGHAVRTLTVVIVPILVAILIAGVFDPVVARFRGRLPSFVVPLVIVIGLLTFVTGGMFLLGEQLAEEVPRLADDVRSSATDIGDRFGVELPELLRPGPGGGPRLPAAAEALQIGAEILVGIFLTLALAFLFMKDGPDLWRGLLARLRGGARERANVAGHAAWSTVGSYVRGLTVVAVFDAVATTVGLLVLGVPLVATLAALQLVGSYIPTFGALAAGAAAVLVALASGGAVTAGLTLVLVVVVQQIGNDVIEPWVVGRAVRLHPVVVLLSVTAGGVLWGIAGALLFVPLTAAAAEAVRALAQPSDA